VRHEERLERCLERRDFTLEPVDVELGHVDELGVIRIEEFARLLELLVQAVQPIVDGNDIGQSLVFATQGGEFLRVLEGTRLGELALDFGRARDGLREPVADTQAVLPYFCRNRSTRPAVSISFCLPV
jgi:hypothetical protein